MFKHLLLGFGLSILLFSCKQEFDPANINKEYGSKSFEHFCISCHGENAKGSKIAPFSLFERDVVLKKDLFAKKVKKGVPGTFMQGFENTINDSEIEAIRLYLVSLSKSKEK